MRSGPSCVGNGLVSGVGYNVQATTNLSTDFWTAFESLTANGALHTTIITTNGTKPAEAFRMLFR